MGAFYGRESKADRTCGRGCACPENHGGADVYGSITFDRSVLGLVIPFMALKQTDSWLAHAGTSYETGPNRILEMRFMGWKQSNAQHPNTSGRFDEVHLSPDGRTVTMDLLTGWAVDQFRILVAVDEK